MRLFRRVARRAAQPHAQSADTPTFERALMAVDASLVPSATGGTWRARIWASHWPHRTHAGGTEMPASPATDVRVILTDRRFVIGRRSDGAELMAFDRPDVRWVARSGRGDDGRVRVRCSFVDESFVDLALDAGNAATLLTATSELGR